MDNHSKETRSYNMSQIRSNNTKPEEIIRKYLFSKGLRYRKNDKRYVGKPDIVIPKYKAMVLVNGCFWHGHANCSNFVMPKSKIDYWIPKIERNRKRDKENYLKLKELGWKVIVIWECELKIEVREKNLLNLYLEIIKQ